LQRQAFTEAQTEPDLKGLPDEDAEGDVPVLFDEDGSFQRKERGEGGASDEDGGTVNRPEGQDLAANGLRPRLTRQVLNEAVVDRRRAAALRDDVGPAAEDRGRRAREAADQGPRRPQQGGTQEDAQKDTTRSQDGLASGRVPSKRVARVSGGRDAKSPATRATTSPKRIA
jgi:hypothetical protein